MNENEIKVPEVSEEKEEIVAPVEVVEEKPVNRLTKMAKSQKFFTISVLISISYGFSFLYSLINGGMAIDIFSLLILIGVWSTYSAAKKLSETETLPLIGAQLISGTIKALRIISLVGSILCFLLGFILVICLPFVANIPGFNETFVAEFQAIQYELLGNSFRFADNINWALIIFVALAVVMVVCAVMLLLYYIFFYRYLHKFTYTACENIKNGTPIEYTPALRIWLIVYAVISILGSGLGFSVVAIASSGTSVAATIIAALMLKEHFED